MYFYCISYQAFILALRYQMDHDVTMITDASNIIKACEYLNVKYIIHTEYTELDLIKRPKCVKAEITKVLKIIGNHEIHFSHTQYAPFCFLLINKANENGQKVVFHDFEFVYDRVDRLPLNKMNLILQFKYFCIKQFYNAPIQLGMSSPGTYMICLKKDFIQDSNIHIIHDNEIYYDETLKLFRNIDLPRIDIKILFIAQTFDNEKFFERNAIEEVLNILNIEQVHIKMHPKLNSTNTLLNCKKLPDFLPVEFYFKSVNNIVISFHSASLITASKFNHLKVISLFDIVGKKNEFSKKVKNKLLEKSDNRILFPSNINELILLLNE